MSYLCRFTSGIISLPFHNNLTVDPSQPRPHCSFCANKRALWCCFALYTNINFTGAGVLFCFLERRAIWILYDTISQYFHAEIYVCSFYNQLLRPLCLCPLVLLFSNRQHYIYYYWSRQAPSTDATACISGSGVNEMKDGPFHCLPATTCSGCFSAPYGPWQTYKCWEITPWIAFLCFMLPIIWYSAGTCNKLYITQTSASSYHNGRCCLPHIPLDSCSM